MSGHVSGKILIQPSRAVPCRATYLTGGHSAHQLGEGVTTWHPAYSGQTRQRLRAMILPGPRISVARMGRTTHIGDTRLVIVADVHDREAWTAAMEAAVASLARGLGQIRVAPMQADEQPELASELSAAYGYGASSLLSDQVTTEAARSSFLDFVSQEYHGVIIFLMKYGAMRQDAEDAAQEAFAEAWRLTKLPAGWDSIKQPRAWIRRVAYRKYARPPGLRKRVQSYPVETIADNRPAVEINHGDLIIQTEFVRSILRGLDPETRIVMAFHIDGFKPLEIASELGITAQKVYDLTKKGRKALRAGLVVALREQDRRQVQ